MKRRPSPPPPPPEHREFLDVIAEMLAARLLEGLRKKGAKR